MNQHMYETPGVVGEYAGRSGLNLAEFQLLGGLSLGTMSVLDIGVGAGRTVGPLSVMAKRYVGIDYSRSMVKAARSAFPTVRIEWGDAQSLSFSDGTFDLVNFSYNGIDCVDHAGRLKILSEVRRVLVPGGHFLFSAHNREYRYLDVPPWRQRWNRQTASRTLHAFRHRETRRRMAGLTREESAYALVNDNAHDYTMLHYYIAEPSQKRQLREAGFDVEMVLDQQGRSTFGFACPSSVWKHYRAVKE